MSDAAGPDATLVLLEDAVRHFDAGDSDGALRALDAIHATAERTGDRTLRFLAALQRAGWLRELGRTGEAAAFLALAQDACSAWPRAGHAPQWAALLMEQGIVRQRAADFTGAETLLAEAETLLRGPGPPRPMLSDVLVNRAAGYLAAGAYEQARAAVREALDIDEEHENVRAQANDLNMLGLIHLNLGDLQTAQVYLEQSYAIAGTFGFTRFAADAGSNLAIVMTRRGEDDAAAETLRELGAFWTEATDGSALACNVANEGLLAARMGDDERAAGLLGRAAELHRDAGNWLHMIHDQLNLSRLAAARGDAPAAIEMAWAALTTARAQGLLVLMWHLEYAIATYRLGTIGPAGDEIAEAWTLAQSQEALAGLRRAADLIELLRAGAGPPERRQWLLADKEAVYHAAILLAAGLNQAEDAFEFCERARARAFLDALGADRLRRLDSATPAGARRQELAEQLLDPAVPAPRRRDLLDELRILRAEQPGTVLSGEVPRPSVEEICAAIPAPWQVIAYYVIDTTVLVFLLGRDGLRACTKVTSGRPIAEVVGQFRDQIDGGTPGLAEGSRLFETLIRPLVPDLEDNRVIVVPHDALHYVPFTALWFEAEERRLYLKDALHTAVIPAAGFLPWMSGLDHDDPGPGPGHGPSVVLGDPTGDLPGAAREARQVAEVLGTTALFGADADRAALLGARRPLILHVAGHGTFDDDEPLLSGLHLADGVVTVEDLLEHGPSPRILVLSGCFTGHSGRRPGDELVGLIQAALGNRTRAVVAALWETSDEVSTAFFGHFYDALADTSTVGDALDEARNRLAETYGDAVDWAPYVLFGDPTTTIKDHIVVPPEDVQAMRDWSIEATGDFERGHWHTAIETFEHTVGQMTQYLGPDHPDTLNTANRLAGAYASAGRFEAAIELFQSTLDRCERALPAGDPMTGTVRANLELARHTQRSWWRRRLARLLGRLDRT